MVSWDPALIICLRTTRHSRSIRPDDGDLVSWVYLLRPPRGLFRALAAFTSAAFLGKEGGNPGVVDEVACTTEGSAEEEIEEDPFMNISMACS